MASLVWTFARTVTLWAFVASATPSPSSLGSDITLLVDNDLQGSASNRSAVLLLGPRSASAAADGCLALGEQLWTPSAASKSRKRSASEDIQSLLDYLVYLDQATESSRFWIAPAEDNAGRSRGRTIDARGRIAVVDDGDNDDDDDDDDTAILPALCTQSAPYSNQSHADASARWQVSVATDQNGPVVGYRDHLSFRFLGLRYAPQPTRFAYATAYQRPAGDGSLPADATQFGSQCVQSGSTSGREDCLFLNVFTPYLPLLNTTSAADGRRPRRLRPVMFWIHGGAFTGGTGSDPTFDGGNLAARGDVVVVSINYRLSTLGFLALRLVNSTTTGPVLLPGNYGLADQILALDWVRANIARFGGDPDRITIFGQSAGAGSVRAMMASPQARGKFAAAIPLSNLGGLNYGTTYSRYYTVDEEMAVAGEAILHATHCDGGDEDTVACLRALPAETLVNLDTVARYLVVDGTYIVSDELAVGPDPRGAAAPFPFALMMGTMRDDGAPFLSYPSAAQAANATAYLQSQGLADPDPVLFPVLHSSNNQSRALFTMAARLATDAIFRCVDEATVYAGLQAGRWPQVYYYEFDRAYQTTGWPGLDVCQPAPTAAHPDGDPARSPYLRCHSGELYYVFGNLARQGLPWRDRADRPFSQYVLDSFAAFARSHTPNPDVALLRARGYASTLAALQTSGFWVPATRGRATMRVLDWPSRDVQWREKAQCASLGLGLDYYL